MKRFDHPPSPGGPGGAPHQPLAPPKTLAQALPTRRQRVANASPTRRQRAKVPGSLRPSPVHPAKTSQLPIFGEILGMDPLIFNPAMDEYKQREDLLSICDS